MSTPGRDAAEALCLLRVSGRSNHTPRVRQKYWVGTSNNPPKDSVLSRIRSGMEGLPKGVSYVVFQEEQATTGTRHYQIYIELATGRDHQWLKRNISARAHWAVRKGTSDEAFVYSTKAETRLDGPWSLGQRSVSRQGRRTDIHQFRDRIREGKCKRELWESEPVMMCKYRHMYDDYKQFLKPKRHKKIEVTLLIGPTGTGKTRMVHDYWANDEFWSMPVNNGTMWFDGYDMHEKVLIDEFNGRRSKWALDTFLRIVDWYILSVPIKHGHTWWGPCKIIITSNFHPADWWNYNCRKESYHAVCRRIGNVVIYSDDAPPQPVKDLKAYWILGWDNREMMDFSNP